LGREWKPADEMNKQDTLTLSFGWRWPMLMSWCEEPKR
jgi:hypothetical protein